MGGINTPCSDHDMKIGQFSEVSLAKAPRKDGHSHKL